MTRKRKETEDERDARIAVARIAEIEADPSRLIAGEEAERVLADLDREEGPRIEYLPMSLSSVVETKQIILYLVEGEYERAVEDLQAVQQAKSLTDYTAVMQFLLAEWKLRNAGAENFQPEQP